MCCVVCCVQPKSPPHFTSSQTKSFNIFKCHTFVAARPEQVFEILFDLPTTPAWNKAITKYHTLQQLTADIDTTLCVAAAAGGGAISSRDFVGVRQYRMRRWGSGMAYVIGGQSIVCNERAPESPDSTRAWNGSGGLTMCPVPGRENEPICQVSWILNGDLRGWLPRSLIESACKSTMIRWTNNIRDALLKKTGQAFTLQNGQVVPTRSAPAS